MSKSITVQHDVKYAGIDYHKRSSVVTLGDARGKVLLTHRLVNEKAEIYKFFKQYPGIQCAVESCRGYEWFIDFLKEQFNFTVHLVNPVKTKLIAQSRCKTDKVDSRILMELLAIGYLPTCYQPTPEERTLRERLRWRAHLVRNTSRMKIRIHSMLDKENLGPSSARGLFRGDGRLYLSRIKLLPARQSLLKEHLVILATFEALVKKEDEWVSATAKSNEQARLLMSIPGVGCLSALVIIAELGEINRFKNSSQVASYAGLVPSIYSSANVRRVGAITKEGSRFLRWILVECAWRSLTKGSPFRVHYASVSRRCGRNSAIVSVARKILQVAYRVLRDNKPFDPKLVGTYVA